VAESELLGRVHYIIRAGKLIVVPAKLGAVEGVIARVVRRSVPAARGLVLLHNIFKREMFPAESFPQKVFPQQIFSKQGFPREMVGIPEKSSEGPVPCQG